MRDYPMRRKDRALSESDCWRLLSEERVGRLAMADLQGQPYLVPLNHWLSDGIIYFHCATVGRKLDMLRANPQVCYEVDRFLGIAAGANACDYGAYFESALAFGSAFEVTDPAEKVQILNQLTAHHAEPGAEFGPVTEARAEKVAVVGIRISQVTGKARPQPGHQETRQGIHMLKLESETNLVSGEPVYVLRWPDTAAGGKEADESPNRVIFDVVAGWFREDDWKFESDEERLLVRTGINGENGKFRMYAHVHNENLVVHSISPTEVPESKRDLICEYLTRANYGMVIGNFEMDWSDGEVRYKTSFKLKDGLVAPWMVNHLVYVNCAMMDKYYPGMMSVLYGDVSPEEAVRQVEGE